MELDRTHPSAFGQKPSGREDSCVNSEEWRVWAGAVSHFERKERNTRSGNLPVRGAGAIDAPECLPPRFARYFNVVLLKYQDGDCSSLHVEFGPVLDIFCYDPRRIFRTKIETLVWVINLGESED